MHIYDTPGTFTVSLTTIGPDGISVYLSEIEATPGAAAQLPSSTNQLLMDGLGFVSQVSNRLPIVNLFLNCRYNEDVYIRFSINPFTGLGQIWEPHTSLMLDFNIDTGDYQVLTCVGSVIASGNDKWLAKFGTAFPIDPASGQTSRGEGYWDWWQMQQAADHTGYAAASWPASLAEAKLRRQALGLLLV